MNELIAWFTKLDPTLSAILSILLVTLGCIVLIFIGLIIVTALKKANPEEKEKLIDKLAKKLTSWGSKKEDKTAPVIINANINSNGSSVNDFSANTMELAKTIESGEVVILISKIIKYKEKEKSLEKDFMVFSMKTVESYIHSTFDGIVKEMFFQSNPEYYIENVDEFKMVSSSVSRDFVDMFRQIITNNHLERFTNSSVRKDYIGEKVLTLINTLSEKMSSVTIKLAKKGNEKEFLSFLQSSAFSKRLQELFEELLIKLIDYALDRELSKKNLKIELTEGVSNPEFGLTKSSITLIKDILGFT